MNAPPPSSRIVKADMNWTNTFGVQYRRVEYAVELSYRFDFSFDGMIWYGMVWYGMAWYVTRFLFDVLP